MRTSSTLLAALIREHDFRLDDGPALTPDRPVPSTLDNFGLTFHLTPAPDRGVERRQGPRAPSSKLRTDPDQVHAGRL